MKGENVVYGFFVACTADCEVCVSSLLKKKMSPVVMSDHGMYTPLAWATWAREQRNGEGPTPITRMLEEAIAQEAEAEEA
eukprot:10716709-Lingulodinium_polyedra.AAC.1